MFKAIKDYIKCATRNRFTLGGSLAIAIGPTLPFLGYACGFNNETVESLMYVGEALLFLGAASIAKTHGGFATLGAYRETRERIRADQSIEGKYKAELESAYCNRVGYNLAIEEAGLENLI